MSMGRQRYYKTHGAGLAAPMTPSRDMGEKPLEALQKERDRLLAELHSAYGGAPSTTVKAYREAQVALQKNEDMTFSEEEIDKLLPKELRRGGGPSVSANVSARNASTRTQ